MNQTSIVEEIFFTALDHAAPAERAAYLDGACGTDVVLRRQVERLLAAYPRVGRFLTTPTVEAAPAPQASAETMAHTHDATPLPQPGIEGPGTQIGPYRLLQKIGEGGMGVVYLAEQTEPVRRKVALKIVKPGLDTAQVVARFEAERQALALMDHLNIAKVLDAGTMEGEAREEGRGTSEEGGKARSEGRGNPSSSSPGSRPSSLALDPSSRPYFVMELVRGLPITEYCDQNHLTPRERLELFVPVCQAIQHAHQKGVIHRDIKPTNVLVARCDGKAIPKVIDFGVAKAIDQRLTERTMCTQFGTVVGTLDYMSPEQAGISGLDVDTRSDIYSLGVLLYELLTGTTPLDRGRRQHASYEELLRLIREEEAPRPSTHRLRIADAGLQHQGRRRRFSLFGRRSAIGTPQWHELDWILMKALEKDRGRRYETANALAADVLRYLADEPVEACPPSPLYRLRKFTRKHKVVLAAVAGVAALLVSGVGLVVLGKANAQAKAQGEVALKNWEEAQTAEARARTAARRAEVINKFLLDDLLGEAAPERNARAKRVTVEEVLHRAAAKVDGAFVGQPELEAAVREEIGILFWKLGLYPEAEEQLRAAVTLYQKEAGAEGPDTLRSRAALGRTLLSQRKLAEAEPILRAGLETSRRLLGSDHVVTLRLMGDLATLLSYQGKPAEAEALCRQALEASRRVLGADHPDTLGLMNELTMLLHGQKNQLSKTQMRAQPAATPATVLPLAVPPPPRAIAPPAPKLLSPRAVPLQVASQDEAETLCRNSLDAATRTLGSEHPTTLAIMNELVTILRDEGKCVDAEALCNRALQTSQRVMGADHPSTLQLQNNLGVLLQRQGKLDKAEPMLRRSVEANRARFNVMDPATLQAIHHLAELLRNQGKLAEAEMLLRELVRQAQENRANDLTDRSGDLYLLGIVLLERGQPAEAEPLVRQCLEACRKALPPGDPLIARAQSLLGGCLSAQKKYAEAKPLLLAGYEGLTQSAGTLPGWIQEAGARIVTFYEASANPEKAAEWRTKTAEDAEKKR